MATILVLGAGLGGMAAAFGIRAAVGKQRAITVVGDGPMFNFTPSIPWLAVGWRQAADIRLDARSALNKHAIEFIGTLAERVLATENQIRLSDGSVLAYDYMVIATGPRLAFDEVPGLGQSPGHTQSVCTGPYAKAAQQAYERFLESPGPIVVGAVQGASCFGPTYEFAMILDADLRKRKRRDRAPMAFVTSEPYIGHMGLGGVGDSKGLLEAKLRECHIKRTCNARVSAVETGQVKVDEMDAKGVLTQSHELPFSYAMLLPAFTSVAAVRGVEGLSNPRGFILIDEHQRNPTFRNIYSAGVCVAIPPVEVTPVPTGAPKTGFMIESMVTAVAHRHCGRLVGESCPVKARGFKHIYLIRRSLRSDRPVGHVIGLSRPQT